MRQVNIPSTARRFSTVMLVSALLTLFWAGSAHAETAGYSLSKEYASVLFRVLQEEYVYLIGRFDEFDGTLSFDPTDLSAARLDATVDMTSVAMRDDSIAELLTSSRVWFNTPLHEQARFTTESVTVTGDNSVDFHGQLNFVGETQPWTLSAIFRGGSDGELKGDTVGMTATGSFLRSDFGLDQYMNVAADEVSIEVNAKFERD